MQNECLDCRCAETNVMQMQNAEMTDRSFNGYFKGISFSNEQCRRRLLKGGSILDLLGDAARRSACCKLQGDGMALVRSNGELLASSTASHLINVVLYHWPVIGPSGAFHSGNYHAPN